MFDSFPTGVEVAHRQVNSFDIDGGDLVADPNFDAVGPVLFRRPGD